MSADDTTSPSSKQPSDAPPGSLLSRLLGLVFRRNFVVGVIDDGERADAAHQALLARGFAPTDVVSLAGAELAERVRQEGDSRPLLTSEEGAICLDYNEAANATGGTIVSARTATAMV